MLALPRGSQGLLAEPYLPITNRKKITPSSQSENVVGGHDCRGHDCRTSSWSASWYMPSTCFSIKFISVVSTVACRGSSVYQLPLHYLYARRNSSYRFSAFAQAAQVRKTTRSRCFPFISRQLFHSHGQPSARHRESCFVGCAPTRQGSYPGAMPVQLLHGACCSNCASIIAAASRIQ